MSSQVLPALRRRLTDAPEAVLVRQHVHEPSSPAFAEIYRRYRPSLEKFLSRKTRDVALAQDLAQETLLRAYDNLDSFDADRPLWPWLRAVAGNLAIDELRRRQREALSPEPLLGTDEELADDPSDTINTRIVLNEALGEIPRRQGEAIQRRYVDQWNSTEIGELFGMTRTAVEQLNHRARRTLRAQLTSSGAFGVALVFPLADRMRVAVLRMRERIVDWSRFGEVGVGAVAANVTAVVVAAALVGMGGITPVAAPVEDDDGEDAAGASTAEALWAEGGAGERALPLGLAAADAGAFGADAAGSDEAVEDPESTTRLAVSAPTPGLLPEEPDGGAKLDRDDDYMTLNRKLEGRVPGTDKDLVIDPGGSDGLSMRCDRPGSDLICEAIDLLP